MSADPVLLFDYLLGLGDDRLVLGNRLSEWCAHGPILEEDIAVTNIALDLLGQASTLLNLAGQVEGKGRDADALAYLRDEIAFRNIRLVELPIGDFGFTIARQFLFDVYSFHLMDTLQSCRHSGLAALAGKCVKEDRYHVRHSGEWVIRLGDGTEESHGRMQHAMDKLWPYVEELFQPDAADVAMTAAGISPELSTLRGQWQSVVQDVMGRATLTVPAVVTAPPPGIRRGSHTEHLGHMLAEMQIVARSHPGAKW